MPATRKAYPSGSSSSTERVDSDAGRTPVGYIRRAHGIAGSVIVRPLTDSPDTRYRIGASFETDDDPPRSLTIGSIRPHNDGLLVSFEEVADRDRAEALRGTTLLIGNADRRELDDDEFWEEDLVGLSVVDAGGSALGVVSGVVLAAAQHRLIVSADDSVVEVPFVAAIVTDVDLDQGVVVVDPPLGLF